MSILTKPFTPLSRRQASPGSLEGSHPVRLPPWNPTIPRLTECVRTHSPSASTKGSGTWWSYTGGSPDRPWRLPSSGLFPAPASVSATANLRIRGQAGSYQQALGWDGPLRMSTGRGQGTSAQRFRKQVFRSCRQGSVSAFAGLGKTLDLGGGLFKKANYT